MDVNTSCFYLYIFYLRWGWCCIQYIYCEIIWFCWTLNFVYFMGMVNHEFKKYLFILVLLHILWNPQIQVSTYMSNVVKPWNFVPTKLNDFTVFNLLKTQIIDSHCLSQACSWSTQRSSDFLPESRQEKTLIRNNMSNYYTVNYM